MGCLSTRRRASGGLSQPSMHGSPDPAPCVRRWTQVRIIGRVSPMCQTVCAKRIHVREREAMDREVRIIRVKVWPVFHAAIGVVWVFGLGMTGAYVLLWLGLPWPFVWALVSAWGWCYPGGIAADIVSTGRGNQGNGKR